MNQSEYNLLLEEILNPSIRFKELREILELHRDEAAREYALATIAILTSNFDEAQAHFENVLAQKPGESFLYRRLAEALILQNEYQEAIPYLEKLFDESPKDTVIQKLLLAVYSRTDNFEKVKRLEDYLTAQKSYLTAIG